MCGKKHCWLWVIPIVLLVIAIIAVCILEFKTLESEEITDDEGSEVLQTFLG